MTTNFNILNRKKYLFFYVILYTSLVLGFFFDENSTGGAILDYNNQKKVTIAFSEDFLNTLLNYDKYQTRHSPFFIILLSLFERLRIDDTIIRLIHFHLCLSLPLIFFLCLKEKFDNQKNNFLYLIVGIIFLSPTFRSLSIWPDSRLLGLIFFCFSIYFFLKFEKNKKI